MSYRWVILAVGVGAQAAVAALRQGLPSLAPALRGEFGLSLTGVGVVLGSVTVGIMLTLIAWGALADRIGERPVIATGLTGTAAALVGAALAPSFGWLLAALVLAGMFGASATGASGRAVMGWFERGERGMALGVRQMGVPVGGGIAAIALPLIVAGWSLEGALLALAAGALIAALAAARWMREAPAPALPVAPLVAPPPLRDRRLWRLSAGSALLVVAQGAVLGFLVLYLHDERGWSLAAAAAALAILQVGGAVARVAVGRWSDRLDERVLPVRRIGAAGALLLAGAAALEAAPSVVLVPVLVAAGIMASAWNGLAFTAAAELSGRRRAGTAMSLQNTVLSAAGAVAPIAVAALVTVSAWPVAWAFLALSQLAGVAVLGPLVAEERSRRAEREARLARARQPRRRGSRHTVDHERMPAPATTRR